MTLFDRAMAFVARWEGGRVDHPNDPGGRTNLGITQRVYDRWRSRQGLPARDVFDIERTEADAIYRASYWSAAGCDELGWPIVLVQFDTAVNCGVSRALRWLADSAQDPVAYCQLRRAHYDRLIQKNSKLAVFRRGWLNRMDALEKEL